MLEHQTHALPWVWYANITNLIRFGCLLYKILFHHLWGCISYWSRGKSQKFWTYQPAIMNDPSICSWMHCFLLFIMHTSFAFCKVQKGFTACWWSLNFKGTSNHLFMLFMSFLFFMAWRLIIFSFHIFFEIFQNIFASFHWSSWSSWSIKCLYLIFHSYKYIFPFSDVLDLFIYLCILEIWTAH